MSKSVVYVGDRDSTMVKDGRHEYRFRNRVPIRVPDDFADQLCKSEDFLPERDFGRTADERFPAGGRLVVKRWGAIGDLIMLRAVLAAYQRRLPAFRPILRCQPCFAAIFAHDGLFDALWPMSFPYRAGKEPDGVISMNQVAEQDHKGKPEHRGALFSKELTRDELTLIPEDWNIPVSEQAREEAHDWLRRRELLKATRKRPLVAVQVRGSGPMKSLPIKQVKAITAELAKDCDVVLIEQSQDHVWEDEHIWAFTGRDVPASVMVLRACDLCICFDSGALWMAHWAGTPVLCLMGPTRPEQRISMHTAAAQAIKLNDLINCPSCFERADACRKTFKCMQGNQTEMIVPLIAEAARKMLKGDRALPQAGWAPPSQATPTAS